MNRALNVLWVNTSGLFVLCMTGEINKSLCLVWHACKIKVIFFSLLCLFCMETQEDIFVFL